VLPFVQGRFGVWYGPAGSFVEVKTQPSSSLFFTKTQLGK